ncbi:uncharacterized protein RCC_07783 [Ramularia collo-cygni]|uniref:LysM domain-containing protein n=1 Tax=Ramularia collo-cygni TaxID=112498 RepID=A0A2D3VDN4_9PEZI|nr:uncharacterized protein RCC_07783 [Ramularia collo-cygni]CZT21916.1 uncharacterized protein RCC_07783 [Ramularia collo-cygni]
MQFTLISAIAALTAIASCSPVAMPDAFSTTLETNTLNARQSNCTEYCSNSAGCVCTVRPSDCSEFYTVQPGDTCLTIAKSLSKFTVTQFYRWNPSIGRSCFGLQAYVPVCIATPWYNYVPPVQPEFGTKYTPDQTPVPLMPNIIESCQLFEYIKPGKRVDELAAENGFEIDDFAAWNGNSTSAWASNWACVKA